MISSVTMVDFRGVLGAGISFTSPLTILVGRNGSGKTTVLDALLIGASANPAEAIGRAIVRRGSRQSTAQWLFRRRGTVAKTAVAGDGFNGLREVELKWLDRDMMKLVTGFSRVGGSEEPSPSLGGVESSIKLAGRTIGQLLTAFSSASDFEVRTGAFDRQAASRSAPDVRLVDMRGIATATDLTQVWTEASEQGRVDLAHELLQQAVPGFTNLAIMAVGEGFELGLGVRGGMVPLSMAGDGVRALARLALELAAGPGGLVLLEEPEVHQHPSALAQSASAIVGAVRRGLQVVLTTHSLELIDWILVHARKAEFLDRTSVLRLRLVEGQLDSTRFEGTEADEIRHVIGTELRG